MKLALALVLASCGKHDDRSPVAPPATAPATSTESIALPVGTGDPIGTATTFLRYDAGALVEIAPASIFGDRSVAFHGLDASGTLSAATPAGFTHAGEHEPFPPTSPTAVFVDRATSATALRKAVETLRGRCWGFAVADRGKLELQEPSTCPPAPRKGDQVNLVLFITTGGPAAAHLSTGGGKAFERLDELGVYLAGQKTSTPFAGRTDLELAVDDAATVATLVDALARARLAGFTSAVWVSTPSEAVRALTR